MLVKREKCSMLEKGSFSFVVGFKVDYVFDWNILKYQQSQSAGAPPRPPVCDINFFFYSCGLGPR